MKWQRPGWGSAGGSSSRRPEALKGGRGLPAPSPPRRPAPRRPPPGGDASPGPARGVASPRCPSALHPGPLPFSRQRIRFPCGSGGG